MSKFRKKPVVIEAMTFDEMIQYAKDHGTTMGVSSKNQGDPVPWSFYINEHHVSHENDDCYVITTLEGTHHMTRKDMLIVGIKGEIYPCKLDIFAATYEPAEVTHA